MKSLLVLLVAFALSPLASAKDGWLDNLETAKAQAKKENKQILVDFTGSDWCSWCMKLDSEVFSKKEFKEYAEKKFVLVKVDFPQTRKLPAATTKRNEALQAKYQISGFPTVLIMNDAGEKTGQLGYMAGGPAAFIAALEKGGR